VCIELIYQRERLTPLKVLVLKGKMVGLGGLEPPTSPLSGVRSNQAELQTRLLRTGILAFISSGIKTINKRVFYADK
jgi:hypothetical protein